jgi:hypothetical protein
MTEIEDLQGCANGDEPAQVVSNGSGCGSSGGGRSLAALVALVILGALTTRQGNDDTGNLPPPGWGSPANAVHVPLTHVEGHHA